MAISRLDAEKARQASQFTKAGKIYQNLLRQSGLDAEERGLCLMGLADMERLQGYFRLALRHYQQAARLMERQKNESSWDAQVGWALAARASGRPQEALTVLQKALGTYRREKDLEGQAFTHWALGGTYRIAGDMKEGMVELQTAWRIYKAQEDPEGLAYTACALGGVYRMLGRYADSGKYYREANRHMRQRKDTFGTAYSYCGLGNVERMAGRFHQALPFYKKAERLYRTIGDRVSYAYTLWSIATTHKMLGGYSKAADYFLKADRFFKQTGDTRGRLYVKQGLSELRFLPVDSKLRKSLHHFQNKKENQVPTGEFAWESLHETALVYFGIIEVGNLIAKMAKAPESKLRRLEQSSVKLLADLKNRYLKTGSRFYPKSLPINWP